MDFEWDPGKRDANLRKHGLAFEDAALVFDGFVVTMPDLRKDYGEQRYKSVGMLLDLVVVIAHTPRQGNMRVISMRAANAKEKYHYQERFEALGFNVRRGH